MENLEKIIILFDSFTNIKSVKNILTRHSSFLIISFNYESHLVLTKEKIPHILSEDFLEHNFDYIQKQVYQFMNWYNEPSVIKYLDYYGINLGKLVHDETSGFFTPLLKKFYETTAIYSKYSECLFFANGDLFRIISKMTNSSQNIEKSESDIEFVHDKIRFNIKLGNSSFMFFISKSFYSKIKTFSEIFLHFIFNPNQKIKNKKNSTLLVEFNPIRFRDFILESNNHNSEIFFFGRRRPAVWNKESFLILKKSHSRIITSFMLTDKKLILSENILLELKKKIQILWTNDKFFNSYFSIKTFSIWFLIKPIFIELIEKRLEKTIFEINLIKSMFKKYEFQNVLIFSEIGFTEQIIIKFAKESGINIILLQHGQYYNDPPDRQGVFPIDSDKFIVWGNLTQQNAISYGVPKNKIENLGCIRFDNLLLKNKQEDDYILLAITSPEPEFIHGLSTKNIEQYVQTILKICEIVLKTSKKLVIKLHPSPSILDIKDIIYREYPEVRIVTMGDISSLIPSCSMLIVVELTTAILEAQLYKKPVLFIETINYDSLLGRPDVLTSKSVLITPISELESTLRTLLDNVDFRNKTTATYQNFIRNSLSNIGNASKIIWKFIDNFKN
jgi:hypothetical protein